jgi:hypothetical protein
MAHRIQKIVRCNSVVHDHFPGQGMVEVEKRKTQMKKLFTTVSVVAGLAAIIASPALAQNGKHRHQVRDTYAASNPFTAYAAAPYRGYQAVQPSRGSYTVYDIRGQRVGSDPDATVRDQLARDPSQGD